MQQGNFLFKRSPILDIFFILVHGYENNVNKRMSMNTVVMENSVLLARLFGIVFIIVNLGCLLNEKTYRKVLSEFSTLPFVTFLSGFINLILGLLVVNFHPMWTPDWQGLITFLGWLFLISGSFRSLLPKVSMKWAQKYAHAKNKGLSNTVLVICLLIGVYLTYYGFSDFSNMMAQ